VNPRRTLALNAVQTPMRRAFEPRRGAMDQALLNVVVALILAFTVMGF